MMSNGRTEVEALLARIEAQEQGTGPGGTKAAHLPLRRRRLIEIRSGLVDLLELGARNDAQIYRPADG